MTIDWQLGDVQTSTKGTKSAPISDKKGNPVLCMLTQKDQPLSAPFGASAYNDPTAIRQNICFRCHEQLESAMTNVDSYMAKYVKEPPTIIQGETDDVQAMSLHQGRLCCIIAR